MRLKSLVLVPPDLAFVILMKLLMAQVGETLTYSVSTAETYNIKVMSEVLYNLAECIKTSNSVNTEETNEFIRELAARTNRSDLCDELLGLAREHHQRTVLK